MSAALWAQSLGGVENLGAMVVNVLAVAGGVFVGGLLTGIVVQLLVRAVAMAKVPRRILWVLRVLGGIATGLVVYWLLFHGTGGGGGWGFGGGLGLGSGTGREGSGPGQGTGTSERASPTHPETGRGVNTEPDRAGTLRMEVLGKFNGKGIEDSRFYRIEGDTDRHTLEEIERLIAKRKEQAPALHRMEIVIYLDSPAQDTEPVKALVSWARENGFVPSIALPSVNAP
jgi:hypothetical protein